ncbi:MAG: carbohydrate ABC transporter permease, partial [Polyangiaceae bacterium]|nr:carbohydrate ABC transporter permease [Polyangiaceae bacterium]
MSGGLTWLGRATLFVALALLAAPLGFALVASLTPEERLFEGGFSSGAWTFEHYRALFSELDLWSAIKSSLAVAGATTLLSVSVGSLCAYALARWRFRGRSIILAFVLAVSMFPQISIVPPLYLVLRALGLIDTYPGLVFPYLTFAMPLAIWLLLGFFRQLPSELEEAARVDGASRLRVLLEVVAPIAAPALATTAVLTFIYAWNEFLFALSFTLENETVP